MKNIYKNQNHIKYKTFLKKIRNSYINHKRVLSNFALHSFSLEDLFPTKILLRDFLDKVHGCNKYVIGSKVKLPLT
jgi:hypothetical protein